MNQDKMHLVNKIFNNETIRTVWDNKEEKYYISIVDLVGVLSGSDRPRKYWSDLKSKLKQEGNKILVTSTSSRKLILEQGAIYREFIQDIIQKYENDRLRFVEEHKTENVHIRSLYLSNTFQIEHSESSYFIGKREDTEESILVLTLLMKQDGDIATFDQKFIMDYLKKVIDNSEHEIIYWETEHLFKMIYYYQGMKEMEMSASLEEEMNITCFINEKNKQIKEANQKQLKLEGIV